MTTHHYISAADIAHQLKGKRKGGQFFVNCPAHADENASLALKDSNGKVLVHCHGGCGQEAVIEELKKRGLWGSGDNGGRDRTPERTYSYTDENGEVLYLIDRFAGKRFEARRPNGVKGIRGVRRVLYRLPEVAAASDVFVTEGEKDADVVAKMGLCGTTAPFGAKAVWEPGYTVSLVDKHIVVLPDADKAGRERAAVVAAALSGAAASLKVLDLFPDRTDGADVFDWAGDFKDPAEAGERLCLLADGVGEWTPPEPGTTAGDTPDHWRWLDVREVDKWEVKPLRPLVAGMIAQGTLTFVAGASQARKSLLFLYLARLMAQGGRFLDRYEVTPAGRVAYLVLEDPDRRVKERLLETDPEFETRPEPEAFLCLMAPDLVLTEQETADWLEAEIVRRDIKVLLLDTYQKSTPGLSSFDDEKQSLVLHRLAALTRRLDCSVVVLDHVRKESGNRRRTELSFDDIKGTGGKMQNADTVVLVDRDADDRLRLRARSKDWDAEIGLVIEVAGKGAEPPKFVYAGDLEELARTSREKGGRNRRKVLEALPKDDWTAAEDISVEGISASTVRRHLAALVEDGLVDEVGERRWRRYRRLSPSEENAGER